MVKRKLFVYLLILVIMSATTCIAQETAAPQWIHEAIAYLTEHQFSDIYADVNPNNRYQVSLALANTIQRLDVAESSPIQRFGVSRKIDLQEMINRYNATAANDERLSEQSIAILTSLAREYRMELNVLGYTIDEENTTSFTTADGVTGNLSLAKSNMISIGSINRSQITSSPNSLNQTELKLENEVTSQLNRQNVLAKYFNEEQDRSSDSRILNTLFPLVTSDWYIGAGLTINENEEKETLGYAGIVGEYPFNNNVVLGGQYLLDLAQPFKAGNHQLRAWVRFGNMELGGLVQALEDAAQGTTTGLDVTYGDPNSIIVRGKANWKTVPQLGNSATTSIDFDIPIPQGRIALSLSQEWNSDEGHDGGGNQLFGDQTKASIGLSYAISNEASIQLDYQLINFSDVGKAFAEFSIRF